mmetsp:Transcript_43904/g.115988  ORF Transcript_43904/g.115988 Transcript_43904/m.115988 type:complete len:257 (+) Transcript_43904:172-942(+)
MVIHTTLLRCVRPPPNLDLSCPALSGTPDARWRGRTCAVRGRAWTGLAETTTGHEAGGRQRPALQCALLQRVVSHCVGRRRPTARWHPVVPNPRRAPGRRAQRWTCRTGRKDIRFALVRSSGRRRPSNVPCNVLQGHPLRLQRLFLEGPRAPLVRLLLPQVHKASMDGVSLIDCGLQLGLQGTHHLHCWLQGGLELLEVLFDFAQLCLEKLGHLSATDSLPQRRERASRKFRGRHHVKDSVVGLQLIFETHNLTGS